MGPTLFCLNILHIILVFIDFLNRFASNSLITDLHSFYTSEKNYSDVILTSSVHLLKDHIMISINFSVAFPCTSIPDMLLVSTFDYLA